MTTGRRKTAPFPPLPPPPVLARSAGGMAREELLATLRFGWEAIFNTVDQGGALCSPDQSSLEQCPECQTS